MKSGLLATLTSCFFLSTNFAVHGMYQQPPQQLTNIDSYTVLPSNAPSTAQASPLQSPATPEQQTLEMSADCIPLVQVDVPLKKESFIQWASLETTARTKGYSATYTPFLHAKTLRDVAKQHFSISNNKPQNFLSSLKIFELEKKLSSIADRIVRDDVNEALKINVIAGIRLLANTIQMLNDNDLKLGKRACELIQVCNFHLHKKQEETSMGVKNMLTKSKDLAKSNFEIKCLDGNSARDGKAVIKIEFSRLDNNNKQCFEILIPYYNKTNKTVDSYWQFFSKVLDKGSTKLWGYVKSYKHHIQNGTLEKNLPRPISEYTTNDLQNLDNLIPHLQELITLEHVASNVTFELIVQAATINLNPAADDNSAKELDSTQELQSCLNSCTKHYYYISPIVNKALNETLKAILEKNNGHQSSFSNMNSLLGNLVDQEDLEEKEEGSIQPEQQQDKQ